VAAGIALLLAFALVIFGRVSPEALPSNIKNNLALLVAGAVLSLARDLADVFRVSERNIRRQPADSADQFERRFEDLLARANAARVVIVLDDLDRCEPDTVVRMLNSIKAFLEPTFERVPSAGRPGLKSPVFVIPCDPEAIRNHLMAARGSLITDVDEYLRKFFNATMRVTPSLDIEMRTLVERELDALELAVGASPAQRDGLVTVVVSAFRKNPRRVKQFLNDVSMKRLLLHEREKGGEINPPISSQLAFLAKITAIQEEWPDAYRLIEQDDRAYDQYARIAIGLPSQSRQMAGSLEERFGDFMRATRGIQSDTPGAFIRLKLTPEELRLPFYHRFREALIDGRTEEVRSILESVTDARPYRRLAIDVLRLEVQNHRANSALAIIGTATSVIQLQDSTVAVSVVEAFESRSYLYDSLQQLSPRALLMLLIQAEPPRYYPVVDSILSFVNTANYSVLGPDQQSSWATDLATGVAITADQLGPAQVDRIQQASESGPLPFRDAFVPALAEAGAFAFVTDRIAAMYIKDLEPAELELRDERLQRTPRLRLWVAYAANAAGVSVDALLRRSNELLASTMNVADAPWRAGLVRLLFDTRSALAYASEAVSRALADQLVAQRSFFEAGRPRWEAIAVLSMLSTTTPDEIRAAIRNSMGSDPVASLAAISEDLVNNIPEPFADALGQAFAERSAITTGPDLVVLLLLLIDRSPPLGWGHTTNAIRNALDRDQVEALRTVFEERINRLSKDAEMVVNTAISRLLELCREGSWPQWPARFDLAYFLLPQFDEQAMHSLIIALGTWIGLADPSARTAGLASFQKAIATGQISKALQDSIANHVLGTLRGRVDLSWVPTLEWLSTYTDDSTRRNAFHDVVTELGNNVAGRLPAAKLLEQVHWPGATAEGPVSSLVAWSREAGEGPDGDFLGVARRIGERDRRTSAYKAITKYVQTLMGPAE